MRTVLDTNVLVSGLISATGPPGQIIDLVRSGVLDPVVDDRILAEYRQVLGREAFRRYLPSPDREDILAFLAEGTCRVASRVVVLGLPDMSDAPFLEIALSEDVPLITGNARHYPAHHRAGCQVLRPVEFLRRFAADQG